MALGRAVETTQLSAATAITNVDLEGRESYAGGIRGRDLLPGDGAGARRPPNTEPSGRAAIRGREDDALGSEAEGSVRPARGAQANDRDTRAKEHATGPLAPSGATRSRYPGMDWYFANIADTIAKRKFAHGDQAGPSAAERMSALRRRVASRAREPGAVGPAEAAAARCTTSAQQQARQRDGQAASGDLTSWGRRPLRNPADGTDGPPCSTAQTEAATAVAHHDVAEAAERQNAVGELRRRQQSGARSSWCERQELLDRLSTSTCRPEQAA